MHRRHIAAALMNGTDFIQVLLNLTVNAFQCSPQPHRVELSGRRRIRGTAERPRLCVFRSSRHMALQIINDRKNAPHHIDREREISRPNQRFADLFAGLMPKDRAAGADPASPAAHPIKD